jgi:hypothetical protein
MSDHNLLDSIIPLDFPREIFNSVIMRVYSANDKKFQSRIVDDFIDSSNAVAYRFFTNCEHDKAFTDSIDQVGANPPRLDNYFQERELFGFFITGLASLESFAYSCYALGAILDETKFPMSNPKDISIYSTRNKFINYYLNESITSTLDQLKDKSEFKEWCDVRNVLAHRLMPARQIKVTIFPIRSDPLEQEVSILNKVVIDNKTTFSRRKWLSQTLSDLYSAVDEFAKKYFVI